MRTSREDHYRDNSKRSLSKDLQTAPNCPLQTIIAFTSPSDQTSTCLHRRLELSGTHLSSRRTKSWSPDLSPTTYIPLKEPPSTRSPLSRRTQCRPSPPMTTFLPLPTNKYNSPSRSSPCQQPRPSQLSRIGPKRFTASRRGCSSLRRTSNAD